MADEGQFATAPFMQPGLRVYLDHALRCPLRPEAVDFWRSVGELPQGLPVSPHRSGRRSADFLDECRKAVIRALGCDPERSLRFYSSFEVAAHSCLDAAAQNSVDGADAVLLSVAESPTMRHVVVSWAGLRGWKVVDVPCDPEGCCSFEAWSKAFDFQGGRVGVAVCCAANSEAGTLQPGRKLDKLVREAKASLVRDVSSAFCWVEPGAEVFAGDFLLCSASRMGAGDFGAFAVFGKQSPALVEPEPICLAGAVCSVVERWAGEAAFRVEQMRNTRIGLCKGLGMRWVGLLVLGMQDEMFRLPHVFGVRFPGVEAEALALVCDLKGVEFSSSPACVAQVTTESRFLLALGLTPREARECCTLAVGPQTSKEEAEFAAEIIAAGLRRVQNIQ